MSDAPPAPGTKAPRLAAALSRVEFWTLWAKETDDLVPKEYFTSRKRHWTHVANAIQLEP